MGLSNIFEGVVELVFREAASRLADEPGCGETQQQQASAGDLDAMIGGNGKGKNDGKCNTCGGHGHYSRDCPSTHPLTEVAGHGCDGKGHYKIACPTANPHLKGGGGKGWGGKDGGKGNNKGG